MFALPPSFALPLIMLALVFGIPRYFPGPADEAAGANTYGTASTVVNPIGKSPPEPDRTPALPTVEQIDPGPEGPEGNEISP
jgi:hypothetical protein